MSTLTTAAPVVKCAGGKTRLLPRILPLLPKSIATYAEPFAGGAAVFFALASERPRRFSYAVLVDANPCLVTFYRALRDDVSGLLAVLASYKNTLEDFLEVRRIKPETLGNIERGARFLYLNKTCFNGLWRVNQSGQFNVPWGKYAKPNFRDVEGLMAASDALQGVEIREEDFALVTHKLRPGDFAYFDPPYVPASKSANFVGYVKAGFGPDDQKCLAAEMRRLKALGVSALLSNADSLETRLLYEELSVIRLLAPRSIAANGSRKDAGEILVSTYFPLASQPGPLEESRSFAQR